MQKRTVRCWRDYAVVDGVYNNEVYYSPFMRLATCINCGELFCIDKENPQTSELSLSQIAGGHSCVKWHSFLRETIREYPTTFRTSSGKIGSYSHRVLPENEGLFVEFWELKI